MCSVDMSAAGIFHYTYVQSMLQQADSIAVATWPHCLHSFLAMGVTCCSRSSCRLSDSQAAQTLRRPEEVLGSSLKKLARRDCPHPVHVCGFAVAECSPLRSLSERWIVLITETDVLSLSYSGRPTPSVCEIVS